MKKQETSGFKIIIVSFLLGSGLLFATLELVGGILEIGSLDTPLDSVLR